MLQEKDRKERKSALERHYTIPKEPAILVFPSRTAKGGKLECRVSSLSNLLDYRADDNKESSFEVGSCKMDKMELEMVFLTVVSKFLLASGVPLR